MAGKLCYRDALGASADDSDILVNRRSRSALLALTGELAALRADVAQLRLQRENDAAAVSQMATVLADIRAAVNPEREGAWGPVNIFAETRAIVGQLMDRTPDQRLRLTQARASDAYAAVFEDRNPLVSVITATYDRPETLFGRALPSILTQTHENIEVIVVGDGRHDEIVRQAAEVTDPRFRFEHLPHRGIYPEDDRARWMVAGAQAINRATELARGSWIAKLDDDDEFTPDHVEKLLSVALADRFEMVYGRMSVLRAGGEPEFSIGVYPPAHGQFGFQAAMYMSLLRFFEYDLGSWAQDEPGDWNFCRRMMDAGVRVGFTPDVVTTIYPAGPRAE